jgi:signal transduction histidine kinase
METIEALKAVVPALSRAAFAAVADPATGRLRLQSVNLAFAALAGQEPARAPGSLFPPGDPPSHLAERVLAAVRRRESGRFELDLGTPGSERRVELDLLALGGGVWLGMVEPIDAEGRAAANVAIGDARFRAAAQSGPNRPDPGVAFLGYRGIGRDVTEEVAIRAEAALAQSRLADAIESFNDGFVLFDADDRMVLANSRLYEMAGSYAHLYKPGARYEDIIRGVAATGLYEKMAQDVAAYVEERIRRHRSPPNFDEVRTADGRFLRLSETRTADGGTAVVYTDITDLKRIEDMLRKAAEEAEAASRAKTEFLANMSHELRTPLNAIIGFAEIIADDVLGPGAGQRYKAYARDICASGMHLLDVINQVLDMSKIEAGRFELREEPIDIAELSAKALRLVEPMAREAGVAVTLNVPPELPPVTADGRGIRQILLNLLSNAIKFTPAGGTVGLGALIDDRGDMVIAVSDTGIGMAQEDIPTALAPFGQIGGPMTRERTGTGLGLPIVKATAELHGGSIAIESSPGAGTTVRVRLPAARLRHLHEAVQTG